MNKDSVLLRDVKESDLETLFEQQLDEEANCMAAFTNPDPTDKNAFYEKWTKILSDNSIIKKSILYNGNLAGSIVKFERFGDPEISYWLGKNFWGKGIATKAVKIFLIHLKTRPLYARAAKDNIASIKVLDNCGFQITGHERAFANARGKEIDETIFILK